MKNVKYIVAVKTEKGNRLFSFQTEKGAKGFIRDVKKSFPQYECILGEPVQNKRRELH